MKTVQRLDTLLAKLNESTMSVTALLFSPFVLATDLILLFGCEIVLDVERLSNLLWRLALDHVGHGFASHVQEGLDVEVVGSLIPLS